MKRAASVRFTTCPVRLATWILQRFYGRNDSLTGDLLEEVHAGRSAAWYWRQAIVAIVITLCSRYGLPLAFSIAWSFVSPAFWAAMVGNPVTQSVLVRLARYDWPYSTALHAVAAILPAVFGVWSGVLVFVAMRREAADGMVSLRMLFSLSVSLNVLFIATLAEHLVDRGAGLHEGSQVNFDLHLVALAMPTALSLFTALVVASQAPRRFRRNESAAM